MSRAFVGASSHYIEHAGAIVSGPPLTLAAWVRCRNTTSSQDVICLGESAGQSRNQYRLNLGGSAAGDPVRAVVADSTTGIALAATTAGYSNDTWAHACAVFAASNSRAAYLNGGSKGVNTTSAGTNPMDRTAIGRTAQIAPGNYYTGDIAEVAIWSAALSDAEVVALASGVSPRHVRPESLVAYLPLWGLSSPEQDLINNGATWTVSGATRANHAPVSPFTRLHSGLFVPSAASSAAYFRLLQQHLGMGA